MAMHRSLRYGFELPEDYPVDSPKPFCEVDGDKFKTPTTCFEARDPTAKDDLDSAILYAEGTHKIANQLYPKEMHSLNKAFMSYDEPLYPIPVGASVYYFILIAGMTTFYFTYLGRKVLFSMKQKLDLHPDAVRFPTIPIYWLQQSKREAEQRREVRNTWAWNARRYMLSPNDPLLANVDQILGTVNWSDFEMSRNTWSLIKLVLRMNALFVRVRRDSFTGRKSFEILRDRDLTKIPMQGDTVRRIFEVTPSEAAQVSSTKEGKERKKSEDKSAEQKAASSQPRRSASASGIQRQGKKSATKTRDHDVSKSVKKDPSKSKVRSGVVASKPTHAGLTSKKKKSAKVGHPHQAIPEITTTEDASPQQVPAEGTMEAPPSQPDAPPDTTPAEEGPRGEQV